MKRSDLHRILLDRTVAEALDVRTGLTPVAVESADDGARVALSDGTTVDVDLVIGADGLRSTVRDLVFGPVSPVFQGQACLRAILPRPARPPSRPGWRPTRSAASTAAGTWWRARRS